MARPLLTSGVVRLALLLTLCAACGPQTGTRLDALEPRMAVVGQELAVMLHAATTEQLAFRYQSDIDDLSTRRLKPTLTPYAGGQAVFRWTPLAEDLGSHLIQFDADLGGAVA